MIKKLLIACLFGITGLLLVSQNDAWIKHQCLVQLQAMFKEASGARFNALIDRVDFFTPTCECTNVVVKPVDSQSWTWHAKRLTFRFSWLDFIWSRSINLDLIFEGFQGLSVKKGACVPLFDHIQLCMASTQHVIPLRVKSMSLKPASVMLCDISNAAIWCLKWHSESKVCATGTKSHLYCLNGKLSIGGIDYINNISGSLSVESREGEAPADYYGQLKGSCAVFLGHTNHEPLFFAGSWDGQSGTVGIKNEDESMHGTFNNIQLTPDGVSASVDAQAPIRDVFQCLQLNIPMIGRAHLHGLVTGNSMGISTMEGKATIHDCAVSGVLPASIITTTVHKNSDAWSGQATLVHAGKSIGEGSWQWGQQGDIAGTYWADFTEKNTYEHAVLNGAFTIRDTLLKTEGSVNNYRYESVLRWSQAPYLTKLMLADAAGKKWIDCSLSSEHPDRLEGTVTIEGMNLIASRVIDTQSMKQVNGQAEDPVQGQGTMQFSMTVPDQLKVDVHLADAVVRVPYIYNVVNGFDATLAYDFHSKRCDVCNLHCSLDRGSIDCAHATCLFDDSNAVKYVHVPLLMHECLLSVNKDLFALISAQLLFLKKENEMPCVSGSIILERSQLKENIFSQELQEKIFQSAQGVMGTAKMDMACALSVETAAPIRIETPFLQANAQCALTLHNTVREPHITGSVTIGSGTLYFPYKSLYITKGSLHFTPHQLSDPVVELTAKSKIKKYNITLNATGSLQNHQISLESTPPLTEEQIMALLLIGSHEESLNIVMPALIMSNLTSLLFGDVQSRDSLDVSFRRLFKPFDNVHLVPSFTDQTGRGGLRGAIEIDVTDRLHALIQKNFSLSEDTRVEIEYLLSDDVSVRAIRNERRDVGGEVEMRWKF